MIPRVQRLPINSFPRKAGTNKSTPLFALKIRRNGLAYNRLGVIISAKKEPTSVGRHRIKRLILARATKLTPVGLDLLFIASAPASAFKRKALEEAFGVLKSNNDLSI